LFEDYIFAWFPLFFFFLETLFNAMARPQSGTPLVYFLKFHDGARLGRFRFNWQLFFIELLKAEAEWHEWDIVLIKPGSLSQFGGFFLLK